MEVKPHQIAQVARQIENLSKASNEAKNILKADDICFTGSIFSYLLISKSSIQEKIIYYDRIRDFGFAKGPFFPILSITPIINNLNAL